MNFDERLREFMERTVAYGYTDGAKELAATARQAGLKNIAELLSQYAAAVSVGDYKKAAENFALMHVFISV